MERALAPGSPPATPPGFTRLAPVQTGLLFTNRLEGEAFLTNAVAHNGSGVALGDVDGDGRPDVYFCALQGPNRLFRNLGGWRFEEAPLGSASCAEQLSTGAAFADLDGDGDLDLLVNGIASGTRLFLNDGTGRWTEVRDSGLSHTASPMSLALADIDGDGDLDLYCAHYLDSMVLSDPTTRLTLGKVGGRNVVLKVNDEPATEGRWKDRFEVGEDGTVHELPELDGFYRNEGNGHFTSILLDPGRFQDEQGRPRPPDRYWGLGVAFRDLNGDHAPDFVVCNDNASPDGFWINTGDGHFRALSVRDLRHDSRSTMGVDFADLNRDGIDDFLLLDMLARDPARRVLQLARSLPDPALRETVSERPLFNRNCLYFGRDDGSFVEAALWAGAAATDWSWCPVFLDVDLDGYEDLLVSNGFEQDVMDQDSNDSIRRRSWTPAQMRRYRQIHPPWRTVNAAFRNRGDGSFAPMSEAWGFREPGTSHGMALADLDGDGDLDLVVNRLNAVADVYRNESPAPRIAVSLRGRPPNTEGIGARLRLLGAPLVQSQEMAAGGRYLSDDENLRVFAVPAPATQGLRLEVTWRNGEITTLSNVQPNHLYAIGQADPGSRSAARETPPATPPWFAPAPGMLEHQHVENTFADADRQALLPRKLSRLGPSLLWCDFNSDGWEDLVVTAARDTELGVLANQAGQGFRLLRGSERTLIDQGSAAFWNNPQGRGAIVVALSNFELAAGAESQLRLYSGGGPPQRLLTGPAIAGPLAVADFDADGDLDLFVGGRALPGRYPEAAPSTLWWCEGLELKTDPARNQAFAKIGLVTGATVADLDADGSPELVLATEWGSLRVFSHLGTRPEEQTDAWELASHTGLWTSVATGDFDGDGRTDLVAGNWGRNTAYELLPSPSLALFHGDWHGDGTLGIVEAWRSGTEWYPVRNRRQLELVLPDLAQRFPTHAAFSQATVPEILGPRFATASRVEVTEFASAVFLNRGKRFERFALPALAQLSPAASVSVADFDGDGIDDLFLCQNFLDTFSDLHRDDGGQGLWLQGQGDGTFAPLTSRQSGVRLEGEQRAAAVADFNHDGRIDLAVAQNHGPTRLFVNQRAKPGLRVKLVGPPANPRALGARLRLTYSGGVSGPVRTVQAGSGAGSSDAPVQVLGWKTAPRALWIRWPDGVEQTIPVPPPSRELEARHPSILPRPDQ